MMFTHFFKIYNSCKGLISHSKREEQAQNRATTGNFLTTNTQKPHNEQISKQGDVALPFSASWEQADRAEKAANQQSGRLERAEYGADTKTFLNDVYKTSTRAISFRHIFKIYGTCGRRMMSLRRKFLTWCTNNVHKEKISKQGRIIRPQYGRSMVEMLGVLAIVGVLSVGGIAGYSKAMNKYKMNKFSVAMNELLNTLIQYSGMLNSSSNVADGAGTQYLAKILYKMNALPDGIKYYDNVNLTDMFGNTMWPYAQPDRTTPLYGLGYTLSVNGSNNLSSEICHQLIKIAKENSSQLWYINIESNSYSGDSSCTEKSKCLKNMTISDIDTACHSCSTDKDCRFYFFWI